MTDGLLVIDKPAGMTSHDVVDAIRRRFGTRKVGHAGTLDPDATGVLLVGLGRATRFLSYAQGSPKRYSATARFGATTTTQDASGEVVESRPCSFTEDDVRVALDKLTGAIRQVPPMVSAVKVGGERLHAKARRGEEVERAPRAITVYELDLIDLRMDEALEADLDVRCSSGTFVRTLIHDLGESLGCGAHMSSLRRTETGGFTSAGAVPLDEAGDDHLLPLAEVVRLLPSVALDPADTEAVAHGRKIAAALIPEAGEGQPVALLRDGRLLAVYKRAGDELVADRVVGS